MYVFDRDIALQRVDEHRWLGRVDAGWSIAGNPNGGYLLALATAAMRAAAPHPDPLSVTAHYLRPGVPDADCEIDARVVRSGRTLSTVRATLLQQGEARMELLAAMGDATPKGEPMLAPPVPELPPPDACTARSGNAQGVSLPIAERMEIRLHPEQARPGGGGRARISGWVRFRDGRAPDPLACMLFADAFPPAVFGMLGVVGWVPTVELTVQLRRRPGPGWMRGVFDTIDIADGRLIEDAALWDEDGRLVVQSRQLALLRLPAATPSPH